jgi:hypothetical protein
MKNLPIKLVVLFLAAHAAKTNAFFSMQYAKYIWSIFNTSLYAMLHKGLLGSSSKTHLDSILMTLMYFEASRVCT